VSDFIGATPKREKTMKQIIKHIPIVGPITRRIYYKWIKPPKPFSDSHSYWVDRYEFGGNSGDGSYNELAEFKAEILNEFVMQNKIKTVIEYGCGDGNQLKLAEYPSYIGFDISPKAVSLCRALFMNDDTKTFKLMEDYSDETAELTLSLDVIYHLIEDRAFEDYMLMLLNSSKRFVIIYSSDTEENPESQAPHVKHRNFSNWIKDRKPEWQLIRHIPNRYPFYGDTKTGSFADFFIYKKT
jgi:hypothetical protein